MTFPCEPPNSSGDYPDKLRQRIAEDAARYVRDGKDFTQAILLAARRVARGWVPSDRLPGYKEILRAINPSLDLRKNRTKYRHRRGAGDHSVWSC